MSIGGSPMHRPKSKLCGILISFGKEEYFVTIVQIKNPQPIRRKSKSNPIFCWKYIESNRTIGKTRVDEKNIAIFILLNKKFLAFILYDQTKYSFSGFK